MAAINVNGYRIKVRWYEDLLPLWDFDGTVRKTPRNLYQFDALGVSLIVIIIFSPVCWLLSHVPFIWPEMVMAFIGTLCVAIGIEPFTDYFRAIIALILAGLGLHYHIQFGFMIFGFHLEKYLYYILIAMCFITFIRRFYNWVCWLQIDHMCKKYGIPLYDQKSLMDAYYWRDTHYGEKRVAYNSYQEAIDAKNK